MQNILVKGSIRLDQFLKWAGAAGSGGQAKVIILSGLVEINGEKSLSRGRALKDGDLVSVENMGTYRVVYSTEDK